VSVRSAANLRRQVGASADGDDIQRAAISPLSGRSARSVVRQFLIQATGGAADAFQAIGPLVADIDVEEDFRLN
jgi:hypothetical protein